MSPFLPADSVVAPPLAPAGKRAPFGWPSFAVPAPGEGAALLRWSAAAPAGPGSLRLSTAVDDRECRHLVVRLASGRELGRMDLRYAHALETFDLPLGAEELAAASAEGLALALEGGPAPLWLTAPAVAAEAPGLAPALLSDTPRGSRAAAHLRRLASLDSLHAWGWLEGCVLDALGELHRLYPQSGYAAARRAHLDRFFPADGSLRAETPRGAPHDDAIDNIESTLMFSALAADQPDHPWLERAREWWMAHAGPDGTLLDGDMLSAEGSYTVAYPMARLARLRDRPELARLALAQLAVRRERLWSGDALWLRWYPADGSRTFRNWARGLTWHFLGSVRTAAELGDHPGLAPILEDLRRLATLALSTQRPDGLWNCFLDEPATGPETSGSAGLATALALSARAGWIAPVPALAAARRAHAALLAHLAPDGHLGGVSQANRGGEALQRSGYRVLSSMGAGLLGQLHAALA